MNCPTCGAVVPAANVNISALVGKCDACNAVFRVTDHLPPIPTSPPQPIRVPQPASIRTAGHDGAWAITRRWYSPTLWALFFFCVAWDSFLGFWYWAALSAIANGKPIEWLAVIFPVAHVAVGVGLTYSVLAGFLNTTFVGVTSDWLTVRHRPVPWVGNADIPVADIREIYVEDGNAADPKPNSTARFRVITVLGDAQAQPLLTQLEVAEARFTVQQLNDWLGLAPSRLGIPMNG